MRPDLDNRHWDKPLNREKRYRHSRSAGRLQGASGRTFVSEGYVLAKELAVKGSGRPIPPGESAITSLATGPECVYGATSGERAHLFVYFTTPHREVVIDVLTFDGHTAVRNALVCQGGYVYAGTAGPDVDDYAGGEVLQIERTYTGDVIQEWGHKDPEVRSLGVPAPGEGVACLIGDAPRNRIYGLTDRTGTLFSVDDDGKIETFGPIDELHRFSPTLMLGPDAKVYGVGTAGTVHRFDPDSGEIARSGMHLPSLAGRGQYSAVGAWAMDPRSGVMYAGDVADGLLSRLDVQTGEIHVLGKPTGCNHVRALAVAPDGRVYGFAGLRDEIGRFFCYTPPTQEGETIRPGEMRDLGVLVSGTERRWYGHEFDCAVAGPDGRIYLGESDRISHLFVYFPPMLPVTATEASRWVAPKKVVKTGSEL